MSDLFGVDLSPVQRVLNEDEQLRIPLYGHRNYNLEWRTNFFGLSRSRDAGLLLEARDAAYQQKLDVIRKRGRGSGALAGYDPAGAGSPWYSVGPRNVNGRIKSLAVHPTDPQTVYAGAAAGGVWKTVDGGQTWDPLWDMQESLAIGALAIAPGSPDTVYAGTGEWTPGYSGNYGGTGVYLSTDAGTTWSRRPAVISRHIAKIAIDPMNAQQLWLCGDAGLEHSTDAGVTWTTLIPGTSTKMVTDVTLDPLDPSTVFIAATDGFYKSTDSGTTFSLLPGFPTGVTAAFPQISIGKSGTHRNNFILVHMAEVLQTSTDGGQTFTILPGSHSGTYPGWNDACAVAPDNESIIFWGGTGLDRTDNSGTSWASSPVHSDQHAIVFAPSNPNIVYFANDGGVYRSDDKGVTIVQVSNGLVVTQFYNIGLWRPLGNVFGGGAQDTGVNLTTSGLTWTPILGGDGGWIVMDPTDPRTIYSEWQGNYPGNIRKTTDGGKNWADKTAGIVGPRPWEGVLTMDPQDHLKIFYGTDRVLRSTDGLTTAWTESSQILSGAVTTIAIAPAFTSRIYVGTITGSIYRSDDGGNTSPWADKSSGLPVRPITSITTTGDEVLASVGGLSGTAGSQSAYHSADGGSSWTDVSGDLPQVVGNSIVRDPSNVSIYYLATDTGVWRTTNGGANWLAFDAGMPNCPCTTLVVDAGSKFLYCGTMGRGAYKLDITPGVTKSIVDLYVRDDNLDTGEHLPTPSGLPDPLVPSPGLAQFWMSPDIKVNHLPFFTKAGVFDGVDFDTALVHQDPYRGRSNRFYVQVHNRGWQSTHNVSVRAFIADASAGLPNLPNALTAPDFNLVSTANWTPVGAAQTVAELKPNRPAVRFWDFVMPIGEATHSCCLVVVSSPDDPYNSTATNIAQLVTNDKHVCLKNLNVVDPGPGGMPPNKHIIDFHNPFPRKGVIDIIIRPNGFSSGRIGLLLPQGSSVNPDIRQQGVSITRLAKDDPVGTWYTAVADEKDENRAEALLQKRFQACDRTHIFEFDTSMTETTLRGISIAANQTLHAILVATLNSDVYLTGPARFDVIQLLEGKVAGGCTFQFGYELPPPGTVLPCRRIRMTADSIHWEAGGEGCRPHGHGSRCSNRLVARVMLADDPARSYGRIIQDVEHEHEHEHKRHDDDDHPKPEEEKKAPFLFDGIVQEGDSLSLSIISVHSHPVARSEEGLYTRRFDGRKGIRSWLGEYEGEGKEGLKLKYGVDEVQMGGSGPETD